MAISVAQMSQGVRGYVIIALLAALSALAGIFTLPPLDRDESRFAQATSQMLETGDLVRINFLDESRNKKPIGIHWMQAASVSVFSDVDARQIWAYRIPSLLGVVLAALACFWGGIRIVGREMAFVGASLFAVTVLLGIEGGIAKTDAMLVGCTTLAMAALANLRLGDGGKKTALLFWLAIGLGALIKGPVTPMVAALAVITLIIWERRASWLKPLMFWPGPILAVLIVAPWLVGIQIATDGAFLREALGDDLGPKLVSGHERHGGIFGYHLFLLPLMFFPAILFLVPGIGRVVDAVRGKIDGRAFNAAKFLIAWAIPTWLVFELLPTKLPHYVLPAYPALALMAGWGFVELAKAAQWQRWVSWALFGFAGLVFAVVLPVAFVMYGENASWDAVRLSLAGFQGGFELGFDPVLAAGVFAAVAIFIALTGATLVAERGKAMMVVLMLALAAGLSWQVATRGVVVPNAYAIRLADQVRVARSYSQTIAGISPEEIVTASSYTEPSLVFSLGTDTMLGTAQEVLAFAAGREEPTMLVLDLSRDAQLRDTLLGLVSHSVSSTLDQVRTHSVLGSLQICHASLGSGTNYSRGDETTLILLFTRCASDESSHFPPARIAGGAQHHANQSASQQEDAQ